MSSMKETVGTASRFLIDLYPQAADVRLEEISEVSKKNRWQVVLSFHLPQSTALTNALHGEQRLFKTVEIDKASNEPLSLLVWKQ